MFTNIGLVEHVKMALRDKWAYVYSTIGKILTEAILQQAQVEYPKQLTATRVKFIRKKYLEGDRDPVRSSDCINLIKSYIWWNSGDIKVDPFCDKSADDTFEAATVKGTIDTMPEIPGLCVRYPGHIGVYIGDGKVIEARGTNYGIVQTNLKERGWTHWLKYPYIIYEGDEIMIKKGDKGDQVKDLQTMLNKLGRNLVVDGDFGSLTEVAVREFQQANGIHVSGIVDIDTMKALLTKISAKAAQLITVAQKLVTEAANLLK